ncbi:MAG: hypothetical protein E6933_00305 [Clostridiales bacterium]|jgi:hypothetical protein|nr:hypothetical protein [Clostridiales bacterium]
MLSKKYAEPVRNILVLVLIGVFSFFVVTSWLPDRGFIKDSLESVEESSNTVMKFSAATLSTSLAISALPDDFATPLADSLADMNIYFIAILVMLHFEQLLIRYGVKLAFAIAIPAACGIGILSILLKKDLLKGIAARVAVLGLAVALVVPCSTHITNYIAADLTAYVENTIADTEDGADKLNEAMEGGAEEQTIFEKLSDLFQTAINDMSNLMAHFQNTIRKCMNSIAILILTNCLMPIVNFFILKWILKETFHIAIPMPQMRRKRHSDSDSGSGSSTSGSELLVVGE